MPAFVCSRQIRYLYGKRFRIASDEGFMNVEAVKLQCTLIKERESPFFERGTLFFQRRPVIRANAYHLRVACQERLIRKMLI